MKNVIGCLLAVNLYILPAPVITIAQSRHVVKNKGPASSKNVIRYGLASYYAKKFHGRETSNGSIYNPAKLSAACNIIPPGTWVKVTNLRNKKSVIVLINDRLHRKTRRLIDLSKCAAQRLGYIKRGITRVSVEVLKRRRVVRTQL